MAALRRLVSSFTNIPITGSLRARKQTSAKTTRTVKLLAAGAGVTAAAGAACGFYLFHDSRAGLASHVEARVLHLALPSVSATDKVQWDVCQAAVFFLFFFFVITCNTAVVKIPFNRRGNDDAFDFLTLNH